MRRTAFLAIPIAALSGCVTTDNRESFEDCYDLKIRATPVAHVPTIPVRPDEPNVIVFSWPWFIDFQIFHVIDGEYDNDEVTVHAIQHAQFIAQSRTWFLRKNSAGFYNLIRGAEASQMSLCGPNNKPVEPYIRLADGQTYGEVRRESEEYWKSDSDR